MQRFARLQLVGPVVLFCAVLAAEVAAYALAQAPSSGFLWYPSLEVCSIFRRSRAALAELGNVPFAQMLVISGPMVLIGLVGLWLRQNLYLAISSNLSFCFAAFLAYNWHAWTSAVQIQAASLAFVPVPGGSILWVFAILTVTSFLSFAASHYLYIGALRCRA
jgi:hypothetical protein